MKEESNNIDLKLPTKWEDLTDKQLRFLFGLLAQNLPAQQIKAYCLFRWSGMLVMHRYGKGWYCKFAKDEFLLFPPQVNAAIASLDWIESMPQSPVRLSRLGKYRAVPADFDGVPFESFIVCDNLYQGYLSTKNDELLEQMATHLYICGGGVVRKLTPPYTLHLTQTERISVFYWFSSLKDYLAKRFKHFFQPLGETNGNMFEHDVSQYEMLQNAVNAQIRALTKGDITKEAEVLALDTWRALTELDAQAHEYEQLNSKYLSAPPLR